MIGDRLLFKILLVYSVFWFGGGVIALTITLVGKVQMNLPDTITGALNASMGFGIGIGSISAAILSKKDVRLTLVRLGSIGLFCGMAAASIVAVLPIDVAMKPWLFGMSLFVAGFFGGWIAVPLQVFIQAHPPAELKGRVIAVMNVMTWIGILLASVYYFGALAVTGFKMNPSWILMSIGIIMILAVSLSRLNTQEHLKEERELPA